MDLATFQPRLWWCGEVPIRLSAVILSPAAYRQMIGVNRGRSDYARASHVHIVHFSAILACLKHENAHVGIFRQTTGNDGTTCTTTAYPKSVVALAAT